MSLLVRTYTFTDGTVAYGSQVDAEIANIVNTLNNLDGASTVWTNVKVTTLLPQADVNAGGHKITNLGTPTTTGDAVAYPVTASVISTGTITSTQLAAGSKPVIIFQSSQVVTTLSQSVFSTIFTQAISPGTANNKIWISANIVVEINTTGGVDQEVYLQIQRNGSTIFGGSVSQAGLVITGGGAGSLLTTVPIEYVDSPATTSSTSYTIQATKAGNPTVTINGTSGLSGSTGISTLTVMDLPQ